MATIKINCGYCKNSKGCKIKKELRETVQRYPDISVDKNPHDYTGYSFTPDFKLKCPYQAPRYSYYQKVQIKIPYGAYRTTHEWECNWDVDYCDGCRNEDRCKDGVVTFKSKKYKGEAILNAEIFQPRGNGKYIVKINNSEYNSNLHYFNRYDKMCHKFFDGKIQRDCWSRDYTGFVFFFANEKLIKAL